MSNLEPINKEDLELGSKFGKVEPEKGGEEKKEDLPKLENEPAKETVSAEKDSAYDKILSKVQSPKGENSHQNEIEDDAKKVSQKQDSESQIQHLVDVALNKGVVHAVKVARHLEDNYVLDMFHDRLLADEFHDALVKRGLIKEI